MREIHIKPVLNGFIVTVGCSVVVFTSIDDLCKELNRYHSAPEQVEKEYQNRAINKSCMPQTAFATEPPQVLDAGGSIGNTCEEVSTGRR